MQKEAHMLGLIVRWTVKNKVLLVLHTSKLKRLAIQLDLQETPTHVNLLRLPVCVYLKTMTTCSKSAEHPPRMTGQGPTHGHLCA